MVQRRAAGIGTVGGFTAARVPFAASDGKLTDDADLSFDGSQLALPVQGATGGVLLGGDANLYRSAANVMKTDDSLHVGAGFSHLGATAGLYDVTPTAQAAAIASPTAPGAIYAQAEAASMKTAVDAIRVALTNLGITL